MGLKQQAITAAALVLGSHCVGVAAERLEQRPWPASRPCTACASLQYGSLAMQLPLEIVGTILVFEAGPAVVNLFPAAGDTGDSVTVLAVDRARVLERHRPSGLLTRYGIETVEQFYDLLGRPAEGEKTLAFAKDVEQVSAASSYVKYSRDRVHAYWMQSTSPGDQLVHIVINGHDTVYMLAGPVTPPLLDAVLANLQIRRIP